MESTTICARLKTLATTFQTVHTLRMQVHAENPCPIPIGCGCVSIDGATGDNFYTLGYSPGRNMYGVNDT